MGVSTEPESRARSHSVPRLLGLGNEILGDDALGIAVAREAGCRFGDAIEAVTSPAAGFHLLDHLIGVERLLLVKTVITGQAEPGAIQVFDDGGSPPGFGIFEVLAAARKLDLPVPAKISIITVEAADRTTVGGKMHPQVEAAIPKVVEMAGRFLEVARYG